MTRVLGSDLKLGDTIAIGGKARTIVRLEPYDFWGEKYPGRMAYWPTADGHPDGVVVFDQDRWQKLP